MIPNQWYVILESQEVKPGRPVDDENMIMMVRAYQRFVNVPLLREAVNLTNARFSYIIERQDRRVVITQRPKCADLRIGEHPIIGDDPIVKYRRRRRELIEAAQSAPASPA